MIACSIKNKLFKKRKTLVAISNVFGILKNMFLFGIGKIISEVTSLSYQACKSNNSTFLTKQNAKLHMFSNIGI